MSQLPLQPPPDPRRPGRRLTHKEFHRICEWVKKNWRELLAAPATYTELAAKGTEALNIICTPDSIKEALEETELRKHYRPKVIRQYTRAVPAANADAVATMTSDTATLARSLATLYREVEVPVPGDLVALTKRLNGGA